MSANAGVDLNGHVLDFSGLPYDAEYDTLKPYYAVNCFEGDYIVKDSRPDADHGSKYVTSGGTVIKGRITLVDAKKKPLGNTHAKEFRYTSSNSKIATVSANGKITARAKGICYVYVYARNGYAKKVKVLVK